MISVILYGRNDNYGYNLHKRAALSINNFASILSDGDEILFCDYNSPNQNSTFIEAIFDTLTMRALRMLKVYRVRPEIHLKYYPISKTKLKVIEPIARNVLIKRCSSQSRWIVNSNTDIIALPRDNIKLREVLSNITSKYAIAPRFELPESLWAEFSRQNVDEYRRMIMKSNFNTSLQRIVKGDPWNLFDAPGDFQVVDTSSLKAIGGFDEEMDKGWHCDSNLNKRLNIEYGEGEDLSSLIDCYHCSHTREITPMHSNEATFNDPSKFIYNVVSPLANVGRDWGLSEAEVEQIDLNFVQNGAYSRWLSGENSASTTKPNPISYCSNSFEKYQIENRSILPFVVNEMANLKEGAYIQWFGDKDMLINSTNDFFKQKFKRAKVQLDTHERIIPDVIFVGFFSPFCDNIAKNASIRRDFFKYISGLSQTLKRNNTGRDTEVIIMVKGIVNTRYEAMFSRIFKLKKLPFSVGLSVGQLSRTTSINVGIFETSVSFRVRNYLLKNCDKRPKLFAAAKFLYRLINLAKFR